MSVRVVKSQLIEAHRELLLRWDATRERWDDSARSAIQRDTIDPLHRATLDALKALDALDELITRARRDCAEAAEEHLS